MAYDPVLTVQPEDICGSATINGRRVWLFNNPRGGATLEAGIDDGGDVWITFDGFGAQIDSASLFGSNGELATNDFGYVARSWETLSGNRLEHDGVIVEAPVALVAEGAEVGSNIGTSSADISLGSIPDTDSPPSRLQVGVFPGADIPTSLCQGVSPSTTFAISNQGICQSINVDFDFTNELIGDTRRESIEVEPGQFVTRDFTLEVPTNVAIGRQQLYSVDARSDAFENPDASLDLSGEILQQAEMALDRVERPDSVCVGSGFNVRAIVENLGDCASEARARFANRVTGETSTVGPVTIAGGNEEPLEFTDAVPEDLSGASSTDIDIEVEQKISGVWEPVTGRTVSLGIAEPSVNIVD